MSHWACSGSPRLSFLGINSGSIIIQPLRMDASRSIACIVFDSLKEGRRWCELRMLERGGYISDLERQKKFVLIPKQRDEHGRLLERECAYYADFYYIDTDTGQRIVEDTKKYRRGTGYSVYVIKRKLLLEKHGLRIKEI